MFESIILFCIFLSFVICFWSKALTFIIISLTLIFWYYTNIYVVLILMGVSLIAYFLIPLKLNIINIKKGG